VPDEADVILQLGRIPFEGCDLDRVVAARACDNIQCFDQPGDVPVDDVDQLAVRTKDGGNEIARQLSQVDRGKLTPLQPQHIPVHFGATQAAACGSCG
jgi:hypothetical protein